MPASPLKVLFVASECAPFAKTGGLADVAGALPKALRALGIDVRVVMPLYSGVAWNDQERLDGTLSVPMYYGRGRAAVRLGKLPGSEVPVYFIEHHGYYDRPHLYGPPGDAYSDNLERFVFFCKASLELCKAIGFIPDVVHAHDWQAALVPVYINTLEWGGPLHGSASVFTIHNMAYQGVFDASWLPHLGLGWELMRMDAMEYWGRISYLKGGIVFSRLITTVSPRYAQEIQTPELGFGFDGILRARESDLVGILNGIDYDQWDPERDPNIPKPYTAEDLDGKLAAKQALLERFGLPASDGAPAQPVVGLITRMVDQKGFDLLADIADELPRLGASIVLLGSGERRYEDLWLGLAARYPDRVGARIWRIPVHRGRGAFSCETLARTAS